MNPMHKQGTIFVTVLAATIVIGIPAYAESVNDPPPILTPENPNEKMVLFDNSHGQTAGQSDWVIDGAFSDFAEALADEGYLIHEFRGTEPLSDEALDGYDVFVIPEAQIPFKQIEQEAIASFAEEGGGVFFIADHYNADRNFNRFDSNEIMNGWRRGAYEDITKGMSDEEIEALEGVVSSDWLAEEFGVRFRYNSIDNTVANSIVSPDESFGITENIDQLSIHAGSTLAIMNPDIAKGIAFLPDGLTAEENKWGNAVDQGVYHGGGVAEGPYAAIGKKGLGKAAFIGDSSPVEDATPKYRNEEHGGVKRTYDGFIDQDNGPFLVQVVNWLAEQESYVDFTAEGITLDEVSPLLEMEQPAQTTEPQQEPWREPQGNYRWYDRSTFAPGSFGSGTEVPKEVEYTVETPASLPLGGEPFEVTIKLSNLAKNQTLNNLDMQVYLTGGQAISQIQLANGNWPNSYGYQNVGAIIADDSGAAEKTVTMRLNPNVNADTANIRLRNDRNNVLTKSVQLSPSLEEIVTLPKIQRELQFKRDIPEYAVTGN
ncbi:DNA-binding protein [Shouchella patagoniensis]|uniref:DNA-binding protein n=1 Tax=Shouchella patagoniensis TaxID=228576 RepID=UPI0009959158|nr:DNA-binding protein [Shouchella patagoniensis]